MKHFHLNYLRLFGLLLMCWLVQPSLSAQCTVSVNNKTISQAIKVIEDATDYSFFYSETVPDLNNVVTLKSNNESIQSVLDKLFKDTDISYKIQNKQVVLSRKGTIKDNANTKQVKSTGKITIRGKVVGADGDPLIGVSVMSNEKKGTITNVDGEYVLNLDGPTSVTFSYIGYEEEIVKVRGSKQIDIMLHEDNIMLDDVVVVGYGTQKKINLTGAVQSVSSDEILRRSVSTGSAALQGIVPGLTAVVSSGQPGADQAALKIRGLGSLNSSTAPLVLIDGIEGDMNRIDLNTVESITVLKDAASVSIYGSRASNGVILVTTKRGSQGKVKVSFNGYVGINTPTTLPEPASAIEYMQSVDIARKNANQAPLYTETIKVYENGGVDNINYYDTNWRDEVINSTALSQNYSVNVSGGTDIIKLFGSAGYYSQDGQIDNNRFSRTTLRLNSDTKINKWTNLGIDLGIRQAKAKSPVMDSPRNLIGKALTMTPIMSGINADGTWGYGINGTNPIAMIQSGCTTNSTAPEYSAKLSLNINPTDWLNIFGAYSWKRNDGETNAFVKPYQMYENGVDKGQFPTTGSSKSEERTKQISKQFNLQATAEKDFGKNYIKALLGFQSEEMNFSYLITGRKNFEFDGYQDIVNGDISTATNSSSRYSWALLSYFFRVNYAFAGKYLLEVNGRYDGTSRFKEGNRWGFFPSVSAGWRISEEKFFKPARKVVDNLKLRLSYGELGNQAISGYYPYSAAIGASAGYGYWFDKQLAPGVAQIQLANPDITWEKSKQFDVGLDAALWGNRFTFEFDYYVRNITDMLQQFPVPMFVGMGAPWVNAGSMRNNGWEVSVGWKDRVGDVNYYVKANVSDVKNTVVDLYGKEYVGSTTITTEGEQYGSWFGYVADGYFQNQDEIDSYPVYGGNKKNVVPGFIRYKDISGPDGVPDGKIDKNDRTILGNPSPRYEFGLTLGADWKGIDLSLFFQGVGKKDIYYQGSGARALTGNYTIYKYQMDYWTPENPNAKFPVLLEDPNNSNPNNMISSFWVKNGAYCRLKNIVLGYTLPKKLLANSYISSLRVYASAQNLFTIKNNFYEGFDPESSIGSGATCYPVNQTFIFGLNVEF